MMRRALVLAICSLAFQKPEPAPELARLERLVGTWTGTGQMVDWDMPKDMPKALKDKMPVGAEGEKPEEYAGGGTYEWTLDGMFLKGEGWHEMGPDQKAHYAEYWTWDPTAKKYRTWYFSDFGEHGSGWATMSEDGKTMTFTGTSYDAYGNKETGSGTMTFPDDDTYEWTWTGSSRVMGEMEMKGTAKRKK
jgi:hypothetical protein